ncbi:MAG: hypothetical protein SGPRY_003462, partial [Prymnesium sp.]
MNEQVALIQEALARAQPTAQRGVPIDISVARQYGDSTVTLRTQSTHALAQAAPGSVAPKMSSEAVPLSAVRDHVGESPLQGLDSMEAEGTAGAGGVGRKYTTNSFYEDNNEVPTLLAEIERLKRKALSRGINLTSPQEDVPTEDVVMLKQVFSIADDMGEGPSPAYATQVFGSWLITYEQLMQMHVVLGEPLTEEEGRTAFKAMDSNRSGNISFDDFLAWYTLAHSRSGMLSKKGTAYTARFKKIMNKIGGAFDIKHLSTATAGMPRSLDFRVQFHYNDNGELKQISPWHDIPLYSPDGYVHMVRALNEEDITEIPKFSRAKFEIATGEPLNPIKQDVKNGKLRDYNYGTILDGRVLIAHECLAGYCGFPGDNDPIDAVEIGYRMLRTGSVTRVKVLGCLAMIDDEETDWKVICIAADDPLATQLNDVRVCPFLYMSAELVGSAGAVSDVERLLPGYVSVMREWFRLYKTVDGKPMNKFGLNEQAMGRDYTMK